MTWEVEKTSFVRFDRYFTSKMRCLLLSDNPRIPKSLVGLIMPLENLISLKVPHNWGDVIPYLVSTIMRIYYFRGTPHVLPYQVPLKVGVAKFLWQLGGLEETYLLKRSEG